MRITIQEFQEALQNIGLNFKELADAEVITNAEGTAQVFRTTHFVQAPIRWRSSRYMVSATLDDQAMILAAHSIALMRSMSGRTVHVSSILRNEMTRYNWRGERECVDVMIEKLPQGTPLNIFIRDCDPQKIYAAIDELHDVMRANKLMHNNLKGDQIIVGTQIQLYPLHMLYATREEDTTKIDEEFDQLRKWVAEQCGEEQGAECQPLNIKGNELCRSPGHISASSIHNGLVLVQDASGYGYVDAENQVAITSRYLWADDFCEGRATVQTSDGMGVIDLNNNFVIEPKYEIAEFDNYSGYTRVRLRGEWALFDYNGVEVLPFGERYIDDNMLPSSWGCQNRD